MLVFGVFGRILARRYDQHRDADHECENAGVNPELLPSHRATVHQRPDGELTGRSAEHAKALGEADRGCEIARRKAVGCQINRADESERGAGTLQQAADARHPAHA